MTVTVNTAGETMRKAMGTDVAVGLTAVAILQGTGIIITTAGMDIAIAMVTVDTAAGTERATVAVKVTILVNTVAALVADVAEKRDMET